MSSVDEMCDHSDSGDAERVRNGIAALRAWFFLSVQRTSDPTDVTCEFPPFPAVELLDEIVLSDEFVEFLTLPGYRYLD